MRKYVRHSTIKNMLLFVSSRNPQTINKNGINGKGHLLLVSVLLRVAAWFLRGRKKTGVTHVERRFRVATWVVLANRKTGGEKHTDASDFV